MKNLFKYLGIIIIMVNISSCAGGKDILFEKNPPFEVKIAYYQKWVAGVKEGGSGIKVQIELENVKETISVKEIYFGDRLESANQSPQNPDIFSVNFVNKETEDIIMDSNPINEANNTPKKVSPFNLEEGEAVISYMLNKEMYYYKISNLEEKPLIAYPSTNPNGIN